MLSLHYWVLSEFKDQWIENIRIKMLEWGCLNDKHSIIVYPY